MNLKCSQNQNKLNQLSHNNYNKSFTITIIFSSCVNASVVTAGGSTTAVSPVPDGIMLTCAAPSGSACPKKCKESTPNAARSDAASAMDSITAAAEVCFA